MINMIPELKRLKRLNKRRQKEYVQKCDKHLLHCLSECCSNLIKGNLPINSSQLKKLRRRKQSLRKLILKKTPLGQKRKILQSGGFLGLILPPILGFLSSLISE